MASTRRLRANSSSTRFYWHELWFWKGYYSTPVTPVLSRGLKSLHPYSHSMFLKVPLETQNPKVSQCNPAFVFFCLPILGSWHQKLAHSQEDLISQGSVHQHPPFRFYWVHLRHFRSYRNPTKHNQCACLSSISASRIGAHYPWLIGCEHHALSLSRTSPTVVLVC